MRSAIRTGLEQSKSLLAPVADAGHSNRDDERLAEEPGLDQHPRSMDESAWLCLNRRVLPSHEPPSADPHARWCGEGGLDTRPYPISRFSTAV